MVLWDWESIPTSCCRLEQTEDPHFVTPRTRALVFPSLQLWGKGRWWDSLVPMFAKESSCLVSAQVPWIPTALLS